MNPTNDVVEQAITNLDAEDAGVTNDKETVPTEETSEENEAVAETQETAEEEQLEDSSDSEADEESAGEEYTADDIEVDEPEYAEESPKAQDGLTPEQTFIFNNLPDIRVTGADGKQYTIKVPSQLPEDFEFSNKREEVIFNQNIAAQELNARDLQNQFRSAEQSRAGAQFQEAVAASIREDVAKLQKEGVFPKFKTPIDDPNFEKDPAAVEMQAVLDLMEQRNEQYLKQAQNGATYRFIGFEEAYDIYTAQRARDERTGAIKKEDNARKSIAKKESRSASINENSLSKVDVRPGTTTRDILAYIDNLDF